MSFSFSLSRSLFLFLFLFLSASFSRLFISPHRLFKIASPEPSQDLSRGYEWMGFVKSDLGYRWVSVAMSGFMVMGMSWLGWLWLMGVGWLIWWLVVGCCGCCAVGWGRVVGGFFFFFLIFFYAVECRG